MGAAPELSPLIESFGAPERLLAKDTSCFVSLAKSIVYQQVPHWGSWTAADAARTLTPIALNTPLLFCPVPCPDTARRQCGSSHLRTLPDSLRGE